MKTYCPIGQGFLQGIVRVGYLQDDIVVIQSVAWIPEEPLPEHGSFLRGFLLLNGFRIVVAPEEKYFAYMRPAKGGLSKPEFAASFWAHARRI